MQVAQIVTLYATGKYTQRVLANRFNVTQPTISDITRGKSRLSKERKLKPCGTDAAYSRHLKNKELACGPCLNAHSEEVKKSARRKKE